MQQIEIRELPPELASLLASIAEGEEIIITEADQPVAKLVRWTNSKRRRQAGSARGQIVMTPDFNEPLDDFQDYQ